MTGVHEVEVDYEWHVKDDGSTVRRTWASVLSGEIPWDALDDEEIARGQLRDKHGGFRGGQPQRIPQALRREQARRLKERFDAVNQALLMPAQRVVAEVAMGNVFGATAGDQLRAASLIIDRTVGKTPDVVETTVEVKAWEGIIPSILKSVPVSDDEET